MAGTEDMSLSRSIVMERMLEHCIQLLLRHWAVTVYMASLWIGASAAHYVSICWWK